LTVVLSVLLGIGGTMVSGCNKGPKRLPPEEEKKYEDPSSAMGGVGMPGGEGKAAPSGTKK
jgi:hypothetical protein